jgi:hypothetical protein
MFYKSLEHVRRLLHGHSGGIRDRRRHPWPIARTGAGCIDIAVAAIVVLAMLVPVLVPYYQARVAYRNVRNSSKST